VAETIRVEMIDNCVSQNLINRRCRNVDERILLDIKKNGIPNDLR
jgi:hypothetical protein